MSMSNIYAIAVVMVGIISVIAVKGIEAHTPVAIVNGVAISRADAVRVCQNAANDPFVLAMGGVQQDSPCARLLTP